MTNDDPLVRRMALCAMCRQQRDSNWDLPFFEYRGPGCPQARELCQCGHPLSAHNEGNPHILRVCHRMEEHGPWEYDLYYCGCRGD